MALISPSGRTVCARSGLALPMNKLAADRIIPISRGRRESAAGLVKCEDQKIATFACDEPHALAPGRDARRRSISKGRLNFNPGVPCVDGKRHRGSVAKRYCDVLDL